MYSWRSCTAVCRWIVLCVAASLSMLQAAGTDTTAMDRSTLTSVTSDLQHAVSRSVQFLSSPLSASPNDWLAFSGYTGLIVASSSFDQNLRSNLQSSGGDGMNGNFWDLPTLYGSVASGATLSIGTYAAGLLTENEGLRSTGAMMGESVLLAGATTMIIKYVTGRSRPFRSVGPSQFSAFQSEYGQQSFPSGHTTIAFALSTVLAERLDSPLARISLYTLAALTGCARMVNNQHWFSDVLGGAALGTASALFVLRNSEGPKQAATSDGLDVAVSPGWNGLCLIVRF